MERKRYGPPTEQKVINGNYPRASSVDRLTRQDFKLTTINMFKTLRKVKTRELKQSIRTIYQ